MDVSAAIGDSNANSAQAMAMSDLASGAPRRALTALRLHDFRNYTTLRLTIEPAPVALFGPNGAGKTNILEAISCLAPGRGLRNAATADITRRGDDDAARRHWAVSADLNADGTSHKIGVGQDPDTPGRRIVRVDGETITAASLAKLVRVAWLTPAHDRVFVGPRADRMRFYDRLTLGLAPTHGATANAYDRALRERARLLEDPRTDSAWLDGVEAELARHGVQLAAARVDLADRLQLSINRRPDGAFPKADLVVMGSLEDRLVDGVELEDVEADFRAGLSAARPRDAKAGRALEGPHRTELVVRHRAKDMPAADCSTGEQKALLVGLALAHARTLEDAEIAAVPILLLDEAAAHLDAHRRAALADEICALGAQAWLTGTDAALFDAFGDRAQQVALRDGAVADDR